MTWAAEAIQLEGQRVRLRTYRAEDLGAIAEALHEPSGWFATHWGLDTVEKIADRLRENLTVFQNERCNPLVYSVGSEVAGITRLFRIDPQNKSLEIGGTWVGPKWKRTFVNTEVKFLLLQHCFENLLAERVELRVDCANVVSQRAVARIGAEYEGRLRNRQVYPNGEVRDGLLFSFIKPEWGKVKANFAALLAGSGKGSPALQCQ